MVRLEEIWTLTSQTSFQVDREIRWTLTLTNKPQVGLKIGIKAYYYNFSYTKAKTTSEGKQKCKKIGMTALVVIEIHEFFDTNECSLINL